MNARILFGQTNHQPEAVSHVVLAVPYPIMVEGKIRTRVAYRGLCMSSASGWDIVTTDIVPHARMCKRCVDRWNNTASHIAWHIAAQR